MTATAVRAATDPESVPGKLRARLGSERRAVTEEMDAFEAFLDRIEAVATRRPAPTGRVRGIDDRAVTSGLGAVREAYEETVMAVSHYDEEYGDTYRESVVAEFGPEIGLGLVEGQRFQAHLKRATVEKARSCRTERERFLETLEIESDSIETVGDELQRIEAELREFESGSASTRGYDALEAEWHRLDAMAEEIDRVATARQRAIIRQRREFTIPSSAPDVPTYLYCGFDDDYPLLSLCVELQKRVRRYRAERERGLAGL